MIKMKIDIHSHILPENLPSFGEKFGYPGWIRLHHSESKDERQSVLLNDDGTVFRKVDSKVYSPEIKLKDMKKTGVDIQVLSTVPVTFYYWAKGEDNEIVARMLNDNIANVVRRWPDKFVGLGTVPLQNIQLAIKELIRCKTELNMKGIIIGSHVNDLEYYDNVFEPFWKAAVDFEMPLFIHPWDVSNAKHRWSQYWLSYLVGMPAETTAAALSLAFGGILERHRKLKIILAHGGGALPYLSGRAKQGFDVYPEDMQKNVKQAPDIYLKHSPNVCADTLLHDQKSLKMALDYFGEDSLLLGSDYPFLLGEHVPGTMIENSDCSNIVKEKLLYQNAKRFFNI